MDARHATVLVQQKSQTASHQSLPLLPVLDFRLSVCVKLLQLAFVQRAHSWAKQTAMKEGRGGVALEDARTNAFPWRNEWQALKQSCKGRNGRRLLHRHTNNHNARLSLADSLQCCHILHFHGQQLDPAIEPMAFIE
jgi:hypothetical protein